MDAARAEQLVRLMSRHQEDLFRYIFALLPHEEDAKDVLQETSVALFRKFDEYDHAKPFMGWACGFAFLEVLKQRERNQRATRHLRDDLVRRLARERDDLEPMLAERLLALEHCLHALPADDQELIRLRYGAKRAAADLSEALGASRRTAFRQLERIRRQLLACINRRLEAAG